jgi:hypothetical protein
LSEVADVSNVADVAMDDIGRDYLLLALSLGEIEDGFVDSYFGPPQLREQAIARSATPTMIVAEAIQLRARVADEVSDEQRGRWLDRQLVAMETIARRVGGETIPYLEEVERCFDAPPEPTPPEAYARLREQLDELLPQGGTLRERLDGRDARLTIPTDRVPAILDFVTAEVRALCAQHFPIPAGETLEIRLVTDQPWAAYNWYDGGLRSRIEFNTDLPTRAHQLVGTLGHETFPGHHLEHAWKEQRLVREQGRAEASIQLINTPEAYISEGLAEVGPRLLVDGPRWQELLIAICDRAGIDMSPEDAAREWQVTQALRALRGSGGDAALQLHVGGRTREEVVRFLVDDALSAPDRAEKSIDFITHPLWRTYVFCYAGGERLLGAWCAAAGEPAAQRDRYFRLLNEQLTPSGIAEEVAA